uniref:Uncharacterized protein n=1 Tax=Oryzias latipes TaxID=8090 RepID=A0A3B3HWU9_ORYLA
MKFWMTDEGSREQKRHLDEQLSQQENSEKENRAKLFRLQAETEEKHNRWLLCQQNCDALQKQLFSQEQKEKQFNQKYSTAVQEVADLIKDLNEIQDEKRELTKERDLSRESHHAALTKMKADYEKQLGTKTRDMREELREEAELRLEKEKEKNQMLLQQCRQETSQLQQKFTEKSLEVQDLQEELRRERRRQKEEQAQEEERKRREEESHQQEARELTQAKAELQQASEKNAELIEEVRFLQETVRRECEEREELTAALCQAQQELFGQRSVASHPGSPKHVPDGVDRQPPSGHKRFDLQPQVRVPVPLTHSPTNPNTFRPSSADPEKDRGLGPDKERATRRVEARGRWVVLGGDERLEPVLPHVKVRTSMGEVKDKSNLRGRRK